ncbi:MAG: hypothetical protein IPP66_14085 [Anaerolineales bacterium]|nr:hypothetical protein [Anaerolineales bacterium]
MKNYTMLSKIWLAFIRIAFLYFSIALGVFVGYFIPLLLLPISPPSHWSMSNFEFSKLTMLIMIPVYLTLTAFTAWKNKTTLKEVFVERDKFPIPLFRHLIVVFLLVAFFVAAIRLGLQLLLLQIVVA